MRQFLQNSANIVVIGVALVLLVVNVGPFPDWWEARKAKARAANAWENIMNLEQRPQGIADVDVIIVSDYACAHCRDMYDDVFVALQERPDVRVGHLHFPIAGPVSPSGIAARAAICAMSQDRFNDAHSLLLLNDEWNPRRGSEMDWGAFARVAGIEHEDAFLACIDSADATLELQRHLTAVESLGVSGTPVVLFPGMMHIGRMNILEFMDRVPKGSAAGE